MFFNVLKAWKCLLRRTCFMEKPLFLRKVTVYKSTGVLRTHKKKIT